MDGSRIHAVVVVQLFALLLTCACADVQRRARGKAVRIATIGNDQSLSYQQKIAGQLACADKFTQEELLPAALRTYSAETLKLLAESLNTVSFYSYGARQYVSEQEQVFEELSHRGLLKNDDIENMFQRFLAARMLDKAGALRTRFPETKLWSIPDVIESSQATAQSHRVYDLSDDFRTATVKSLQIGAGPRIIIVAKPGCHFATDALKYFETDRRLLPLLQAHAMLLTIRLEPAVAEWHAKIKVARAYVAYQREDWPGIDFAASPTFYFLKDGQIVHCVRGWGGDAAVRFDKGLVLIGLKQT